MSPQRLGCGWLWRLLLAVLLRVSLGHAAPPSPAHGTDCSARGPAAYILVFTGRWSPQTFPKQYPMFRPPAQWSKLIVFPTVGGHLWGTAVVSGSGGDGCVCASSAVLCLTPRGGRGLPPPSGIPGRSLSAFQRVLTLVGNLVGWRCNQGTVTHNSRFQLWREGAAASGGVQSFAELGLTVEVVKEAKDARKRRAVGAMYRTAGIPNGISHSSTELLMQPRTPLTPQAPGTERGSRVQQSWWMTSCRGVLATRSGSLFFPLAHTYSTVQEAARWRFSSARPACQGMNGGPSGVWTGPTDPLRGLAEMLLLLLLPFVRPAPSVFRSVGVSALKERDLAIRRAGVERDDDIVNGAYVLTT
ncbi:unnamed protein product [Boreogadus saida]